MLIVSVSHRLQGLVDAQRGVAVMDARCPVVIAQ
jgi:hypothetical protein